MVLLGAFVLATVIIQAAVCQNNDAPVFQDDMNGAMISEDTAIGASVYQLQAQDPNGDSLTYGVDGTVFQVRDPTSGEVSLRSKLDYEFQQSVSVTVWVTDGQNKVERTVTVQVTDANDLPPRFSQAVYKTTIPENAEVGMTVFRNILVQDEEAANTKFHVTCVVISVEHPDACTMFDLVTLENANTRWRGDVVLAKQLNYEAKSEYQLTLEADDGVHKTKQNFNVDIVDIHDTPPEFTSSLAAFVKENAAVGSEVLQIVAEDGDKETPRELRYSITDNPGDYFEIDAINGRITIKRPLDRDHQDFSNAFIRIEVKAGELLTPGLVGSDATNSVTAQVTISVTDVNDNGPVFEPNQYTVNMLESQANGTPLPDLDIKVRDKDQGLNSEFSLSLETYTNIFELSPTSGRGSLVARIQMKGSHLVDYDLGQRQYILHLVAQETRTGERKKSDAYVTVNVQDVNDNPPTFPQSVYVANISETAPPQTPVITIVANDLDSGFNGKDAIRYKIIGNGATKFKCNRMTGQITVASCASPGSGNCLDYEQDSMYSLTFVAGDKYGEGFTSSVSLTINIQDVNDNRPIFGLPEYVTYIDEGETVPSPTVQVKATDADGTRDNSRISYHIVGGNQDGTWQIHPVTGVVTAIRPADYELTPGLRGYYLLTVEGKDPNYAATTTVKIFINDANDHPPIFTQNGYYEQTIDEDTPPGTTVEQVRAEDGDPPTNPNGQVQYNIASGAQDKFVIDIDSGIIVVAPDATFDKDVQEQYIFYVIAKDQGQPLRSANATVLIHIRDSNNKNPFFQPSTIRAEVYENVALQTSVVMVTAKDPDSSAVLRYSFAAPVRTWDPLNREISVPPNADSMFAILAETGEVRVNQQLNRDEVAQWSVIVKAQDTAGAQDQTATATLFITILDVNERPPVFGPPWSPQRPWVDVTVREEQAPGSYVTTLVASDPTDAQVTYRITQDPAGHFTIDPSTGVVTINTPLDYETIQAISFIVEASDSGQPPLSSTATVNINIENINDNTPIYVKTEYDVTVPENAPPGTSVVTVRATDDDLGDYGVVRYKLDNPKKFQINPITGMITVADGVVLDRETEKQITITVTAYDSPNDAGVRRYTNVPVYITLLDMNDHPPKFTDEVYYAVIVETANPGTSVIQLTATDKDEGDNAALLFLEMGGDDLDLFRVNIDTGLVSTTRPLRGLAGVYNMTVGVRDKGSPSLFSNATVIITVLEANNSPPRWIFPNANNNTINVLENQYVGYIVTQIRAEDDDKGVNGVITYYFDVDGKHVNATEDFELNPYTGVIKARKVFDREKKDIYTLLLVARDSGRPSMETDERLVIRITDTDDNDPKFPTDQHCCTKNYRITISATSANYTYLGQVQASDKDIGDNAKILYEIEGGNENNMFYLEPATGKLHLMGSLDMDVQTTYNLRINARNDRTTRLPVNPSPSCYSNCTDPSSVNVVIKVVDGDSLKPDFGNNVFNSCVAVNSPVGQHVKTMIALDPQTQSSADMTYRIVNSDNFDTLSDDPASVNKAPYNSFFIGAANGSVHTNILMTEYVEHYFKLGIEAVDFSDRSGKADLRVWITPKAKEVKVTYKRKLVYVRDNIEQIKQTISTIFQGGIVCVRDIVMYREEGGGVIDDWTYIYLWVIDGDSLLILDPGDIISRLNGTGLAVAPVLAGQTQWDGFWIDPVIIAIVLILLLLLLALLLLCCYCCGLWGALFRKKKKYGQETLILNQGTINPLWKGYEDQELSMAVPGMIDADKFVNSAYTNPAYEHTEMNTELKTMETKTVMNGHVLTGDAMDAGSDIPLVVAELEGGDTIDARHGVTSMSHTMSSYAAGMSMHAGGTGMSGMHAGGTGVSGMGRHAVGMADAGTQMERTQSMSSADWSVSGPSRIGATLTRPGGGGGGGGGAYGYGSGTASQADGGRYVLNSMGSASPTIQLSTDRRTIGIQTGSPLHAYYEDHDGGSSQLSNNVHPAAASWGDDFPEGMYQGEIHLGSMRPPQSNASKGAVANGAVVTTLNSAAPTSLPTNPNVNQWEQVQETRFSETREYSNMYDDTMDGTNRITYSH